MKLTAEFCLSHGDEVRIVAHQSILPREELATCSTPEARMDWQIERMAEDLIRMVNSVTSRDPMFTGQLITHPEDREAP